MRSPPLIVLLIKTASLAFCGFKAINIDMDSVKIINYVTSTGKEPFTEWLRGLDKVARSVIRMRLVCVRVGNFGDCKPIKGASGIWELRIVYGPGYRVYFGKAGSELVVLLLGGDKGSQNRDIAKAEKYWFLCKELLNG